MITSTGNQAIKRIRALRQRKVREETGLFFVEGIRIVAEAVDLDADIETAVVAPDLLSSAFAREQVALMAARGIPLLETSSEVFRTLSGKEGPQGLGAVVRSHWDSLDALDPIADRCWVALDEIQDPGNLGTILRTSDGAGGTGVILLGNSTDPHDPTAVRAGMGAVFSQRLVRASFNELVQWKIRYGVLLAGTSDTAEIHYRRPRYPAPTVLLIGSEREGLSPEQQAACDVVVHIPMSGRSDSLNLAVATGIMLYTIAEQ